MKELEVGRELDMRIAEMVMNWHAPTRRCPHWYPKSDDLAMNILGPEVPNYSTDIAAAWEVVEKLHEDFAFTCEYVGHLYVVQLWSNTKKVIASADTVPLAICRAALKAVNVA